MTSERDRDDLIDLLLGVICSKLGPDAEGEDAVVIEMVTKHADRFEGKLLGDMADLLPFVEEVRAEIAIRSKRRKDLPDRLVSPKKHRRPEVRQFSDQVQLQTLGVEGCEVRDHGLRSQRSPGHTSIMVLTPSNFYNPQEILTKNIKDRLDFVSKCGPAQVREDLTGAVVADPVNSADTKRALVQRIARYYRPRRKTRKVCANDFLEQIYRQYWRNPDGLSDKQVAAVKKAMAYYDEKEWRSGKGEEEG